MTTQIQPDDDSGGYIRGGGGVIDTRRLFRVFVGSAVVALVALVVALTIEAAHKNSRIDSLQHHGVPVDVTVTKCLGILSGTGITVTTFQCNGSFNLDGRSYNAVIAGSNLNHSPGDVVKAVADPKHPTSISTATSLVNTHSSWRAYTAPAILLVLLLVLILFAFWWSRRNANARLPEGEARVS
ncbi:MAG TPA: hypothetical protein VGD55_14850 [Acidothermaceae bacterium]